VRIRDVACEPEPSKLAGGRVGSPCIQVGNNDSRGTTAHELTTKRTADAACAARDEGDAPIELHAP
jgi:hypothetical protein